MRKPLKDPAMWAILGLALFVGLMVWIVVGAWSAVGTSASRWRSEMDVWQAEHTASPETWAKCRAICGDAAALLPTGDGSVLVACSCVTSGVKVLHQ
jgi:hypothetical protein